MKFTETIGGRTLYGPPLSIVAKLSLLVLVVVVPLAVLLGWSVYALFRSEREAAGRQVEAIARAMATRAEITIERTRSILEQTAIRPYVQAMDRSRCDPFVEELRKLMPQYANINTFNLQWEFVCSASLPSSGAIVLSAYPELYEKMRLADDMVISGPVVGQLTGRMVVIAAYPVKDAAGRLVGAVTAPINLSLLAPSVAGTALPLNTHARVINGEGRVVISFPDAEHIGKAAVGVGARPLIRAPGTWMEAGTDGVERVFGRAPVKRSEARFGGEEFMVLLPQATLAQSMAKAEVLRRALSAEAIDPLPDPVTASFGVAELQPGEDATSLLARVDAALYAAKKGGRDRVVAAAATPAPASTPA